MGLEDAREKRILWRGGLRPWSRQPQLWRSTEATAILGAVDVLEKVLSTDLKESWKRNFFLNLI